MRNLIKKSLAFLLVAALALTCFVGTLTVSAEDATTPTATIVIKADDVEAGAKQIPVTFTVTSTLGINEALIKVSSNLGDIIAQPTVVVDEGVGTAIADPAVENPTDYNSFFLSAVSPDGQPETVMGEVTKATISAVFVNEAGLVAGETYTVDVEIPEGKVIAASAGEVAIKLECTKYEFTVEEVAACDHANAAKEVTTQPTKDAEGVMTYTCECGETWTEAIAKPKAETTAKVAPDILIEDKVATRLRVSKTTLNNCGYDDFFINFEYDMYDTTNGWVRKTATDTLTFNDDFALLSGVVYYHVFAYQTMYELNLPLKATAYFMTDGVVTGYREVLDTTLATMILEKCPTLPALNLTMAMDIINYATAVQTNFAANGDLATAERIDKGFDAYQGSASTQTEFTFNNPTYRRDTVSGVSLGADYTIGAANNIRFRVKVDPAIYDMSKVSMVVSYTNGYNGQVVKTPEMDIRTFENLSGASVANPVYAYYFTQVALYDFNKTVTATIYYNGDVLFSADYCLEYDVYNYLVQTDANGNKNPNYKTPSANLKAVVTTAMRLAESSRAAFKLN